MTTEAVAERVEWLYGDDLVADAGVLHVSSGWHDPAGTLRSLKIVEDTPRSSTDAFVLGLARARADAIVTTGRILRAEPELAHDLGSGLRHDLSAWRLERLGRPHPPQTVVLTSGQAIDWSHPLFQSPRPPMLYTNERAAEALATPARNLGVRLVAHPDPSLECLIGFLREQEGMGTISLEVGPSTVGSLFRGVGNIQEWMLSVYLGKSLPEAVAGAAWPGEAERRAAGLTRRSERVVQEASGPWSLQRFT